VRTQQRPYCQSSQLAREFEVKQVKLPQVLYFVCACICMDCTAFAQGRGNASRGLGVAAGNAAAAAAPGMANATQVTTQVGTSGFSKGVNVGQQNGRQNAGLPRSISQVPGVAAGVHGAGITKVSQHTDLGIAVQNRQLTQEYIANPSENWERIQQAASPLGTGGEASKLDHHKGLAAVATPAATARPTTKPKSGFWFRSR